LSPTHPVGISALIPAKSRPKTANFEGGGGGIDPGMNYPSRCKSVRHDPSVTWPLPLLESISRVISISLRIHCAPGRSNSLQNGGHIFARE
ncbi:MAG: hypothetical protein WBQ95_11275, partial [Terracidiphilus sp.]